MRDKLPALTTWEEVAEKTGLSRGEIFEASDSGDIRTVRHGDQDYLLGADVEAYLRNRDPRHLAALAKGEATDDDDNPRSLAARVPR